MATLQFVPQFIQIDSKQISMVGEPTRFIRTGCRLTGFYVSYEAGQITTPVEIDLTLDEHDALMSLISKAGERAREELLRNISLGPLNVQDC